MIVKLAVVTLLVLQDVWATSCDVKALENLEVEYCFDEIRKQFNWKAQDLPNKIETCEPTQTFFVFDASDTVRRSCEDGESEECLRKVQRNYIEHCLMNFKIFEEDILEGVFYATDAFKLEVSDSENKTKGFLEDLDVYLETSYFDKQFTGSNKGWSRSSKALELVEENIVEELKPVIVLFSDGRIERRSGGVKVEREETEEKIDELKQKYPNIHIHCVVLSLDGEKERSFWRNEEICDSKDLFLETSENEEEYFSEKLGYLAQRNLLCSNPELFDSFVPSENPTVSPTFGSPTTSPSFSPTLFPSTSPSFSPSKSPTCEFTQNVADFKKGEIVVDNLCGVNSFYDNFEAPKELRFRNVFSFRPNWEVVFKCKEGTETQLFEDLESEGKTEFSPSSSSGLVELDIPVSSEVSFEVEIQRKDGSAAELTGIYLSVLDLDTAKQCALIKDTATFCEGSTNFLGSEIEESLTEKGCDSFEGEDYFDIEDPVTENFEDLSERQQTRVITRKFEYTNKASFSLGSYSIRGVAEEGFIHTNKCLN
eukprot:snap_masked-scaffold_20-processed-gene-1.5-mRNA-1 protein AED:1.00 eAED:1.00 QI:0/0/0/0/1/1/2/0/538